MKIRCRDIIWNQLWNSDVKCCIIRWLCKSLAFKSFSYGLVSAQFGFDLFRMNKNFKLNQYFGGWWIFWLCRLIRRVFLGFRTSYSRFTRLYWQRGIDFKPIVKLIEKRRILWRNFKFQINFYFIRKVVNVYLHNKIWNVPVLMLVRIFWVFYFV